MPSAKRLLALLLAATAAVGVAAQEPALTEDDFSIPEIEGGDALAQLAQLAADSSQETALRMAKRGLNSGCSPSQIKVRREWYDTAPLSYPFPCVMPLTTTKLSIISGAQTNTSFKLGEP